MIVVVVTGQSNLLALPSILNHKSLAMQCSLASLLIVCHLNLPFVRVLIQTQLLLVVINKFHLERAIHYHQSHHRVTQISLPPRLDQLQYLLIVHLHRLHSIHRLHLLTLFLLLLFHRPNPLIMLHPLPLLHWPILLFIVNYLCSVLVQHLLFSIILHRHMSPISHDLQM